MLLVCGKKTGRFYMKTFSSTSYTDCATLLLIMSNSRLQGHVCVRVNFKKEIHMGESAVSGPKLQSMYEFMQDENSEELPSSQQWRLWQQRVSLCAKAIFVFTSHSGKVCQQKSFGFCQQRQSATVQSQDSGDHRLGALMQIDSKTGGGKNPVNFCQA